MVLRSKDGATWSDVTPGPDLIDPNVNYSSVVFQNKKKGYAAYGMSAGISGILKTTDGGNTWANFYVGLVDEELRDMVFASSTTTTSSRTSAGTSSVNAGLAAGTSANVYGFKSKAKLTLKTNKKKGQEEKKCKAHPHPERRRYQQEAQKEERQALQKGRQEKEGEVF